MLSFGDRRKDAPPYSLNLTYPNVYRGGGGNPGKTFGIPCRSVSQIAEAGSTSVFPGGFAPAPLYLALERIYRILYKNTRRCPDISLDNLLKPV
jgi:hypothetical protein